LKPLPPRMPVPSEARIQPPALADDKLQANSPSLSFNPLDQPKAKAAPSPGAQAGLAAGAPTNSSAPVAGATAGAAIAQKIGALQNTPIFAVSAGAAGGPAVKKDATPAQFILPSGLPVVSIATHVQQVLAIDANHAVFLSSDGGTSWQAVPVSWRGRAVRVDMVSHGLTRAFAPAHAAQQSAFATGTNPIPAPAPSAVPPAPPAQLTGAVTDATGAVIPGASISATSHDGQSATAITDRTGHYSFNALAPGIYDIRTQSPGFQQQLTQAVTVSSGQPAVANVTLSIGAATETVEVESADASIQTEVSERKSRDKKIAPVPSDIFEMITDSGERWTSPDGLVWQRK
ncbi:MAG TPA: carboxypeptidase-like regulatory domain-containing protein, partial [Terracidiphilus sp.]|nr:carboxypeptidase-like regulatory domain-containing protein [Terracidiphilus sp.]